MLANIDIVCGNCKHEHPTVMDIAPGKVITTDEFPPCPECGEQPMPESWTLAGWVRE